MKMFILTLPVTIVLKIVGKGASNDTCDIYTSLIGPCSDGLVCKLTEGIPTCR